MWIMLAYGKPFALEYVTQDQHALGRIRDAELVSNRAFAHDEPPFLPRRRGLRINQHE